MNQETSIATPASVSVSPAVLNNAVAVKSSAYPFLRNKQPEPIDVNKLFEELPMELAEKVDAMIRPTFNGSWKPDLLKLYTGAGDSAPEEAKKGDIFSSDTKLVIPRPFKFFPLLAHYEITRWASKESTDGSYGKVVSKSNDGINYVNYDSGEWATASQIGMPSVDQPDAMEEIKFAKEGTPFRSFEYALSLYVLDKDLKSISRFIVKSYSVDTLFNQITKWGGQRNPDTGLWLWNPTHNKWFDMNSADTKAGKNNKVSKSLTVKLGEAMSPDEVKAMRIAQHRSLTHYSDLLLSERTRRAEVKKQLEVLEATMGTVINADSAPASVAAMATNSMNNVMNVAAEVAKNMGATASKSAFDNI